ncbi:methyl-accepting chemotaxis sensory transducer [Methylobacterium sp. GXF4]|uniref:methyl-accepting chemotaxis protein n=1 Tax=Methylobacterium sp. GXF4 TaxID=1096546 RepID=UPI0002699964|nr:methyl-accepting chemotaxis protein [Methylobacterium sp. GXF4]EIZ85084.1 methyl-accepting chemotaxis sensory transducer [Methylobacterium sp. GXF4]
MSKLNDGSVEREQTARLRLGLAGRATLLILAVVCISFAASSAYLYRTQASALRTKIDTEMSGLSASAAQSVGNWLRGKLDLTQLMAQQASLATAGAAANAVIGAPAVRETFYVSYVGRPDGSYDMVPQDEVPPDYDPRQRPWYKEAVAANGPVLTEPYTSASRGALVITAAATVRDAGGTLLCVGGGDFEAGTLARMIAGVATGSSGYAYLVSGNGTVLVHPRAELIGKSLSDLLTGPLPKIGGGLSETREGDRQTFTVFARVPNLPPSLEWYVAVSVDRAASLAPISALAHDLVVTTLLVLLVLGIVVSQLMTITVARPLNRLVGALQRMSRGAIDAEIAEARRSDEIGMVGRAVEGIKALVAQKARDEAEARRLADETAAAERKRAMIALADGFERAVGTIVGMVSSSATELEATAQTLTASATQAAAQSTSVAAAAEEAATNVRTVAAAAEQLGSSVREIAGQVEGSANLAQAAVGEADQTGHLVQELSEAVSKIGDAVGLISSIAAQTNLLALNATIEAARAGEAGRGFAVVASEVKELAAQTGRVTEEITGYITRIQGSTDHAAQAIGGIVTRIRDINDVTGAVAAAVEEQGAATQEIVRNVSQAASGTDEVTTNITGVAQAAEQTGAAAHQVLDAATALSRQSAQLSQEVADFLHTVRAA